MKKGLLAAALAVILTLTACGGAESDPSAEDLPRLVIASDNYKPYSYVGPNGNLIGVDVDLAAEACRRLGYAPEFCQIVWENKDAYLSSGQVDCLWGSFTMTGREDLYQWAGPYLYSRQMVAVRANSDIHTLADLAGRRVAVQATGKPEALFLTSSAPGVSQVEAVYAFSTMDEVYACLRKGYADAIAGHENALQLFLDSSPGSYRMLDEILDVSQLGVAFQKDTHKELAQALTQTLAEMESDGTTRTILTRYGLDADRALGVTP